METFLLSCSRCGRKQTFEVKGKCECGGTFLVEYDIERVGRTFKPEQIMKRPWTMWRYRELLPVKDVERIVSLGEGGTPLLRMAEEERRLGLKALYSKREEQNPTGSFKARGFSAAVTLLNERGVRKVAVNSNGNAATALSAYAGRAGMEAYVFVPKDCPGLIVEECMLYGARTHLVDGYIQDAGRIVEEGMGEQGWFHTGTLREPGRVEGKKTMGLELAEQLGWQLPDVVVYPTGGGSGIIGMWRAFAQLKELGLVQGDLPRLVSVQESGCEPLVQAINGARTTPLRNEEVTSDPTGMRVPNPPDLELIASILRASGGTALAVSRLEIGAAVKELGAKGLSCSPEGAAAWAGLLKLRDQGLLRAGESAVWFNTCHASKYWPWTLRTQLPVLRNYQDFVALPQERG